MTDSPSRAGPKPLTSDTPRRWWNEPLVYLFVIAPFLALITTLFVGGMSWLNLALFVGFYTTSVLGVTVGYHRLFTHKAFKANRGLKMALAVAGETGFQGAPISWVADHRRHHAFSDKEGDPHSPWLFGTSPWALAKGFWHAHIGWLFHKDTTNVERFAPDLDRDADIKRVDGWFWWVTVLNLTIPAAIGGLVTWSWHGALTAFIWNLVRIFLVHHVTWSTNSICHMWGDRPFKSRDKAANFWPLAILSMGESWHNSHHADPTCARHGVDRGQIDVSARTIWLFEKFGWATEVRWPDRKRLDKLRLTAGETSAEA